MKNICRLFIYLLAITSFITACSKKELAMPSTAVVKVTLAGYSFGDTLEAVRGNVVIATLRANSGFSEIALIAVNGDKEQIGIRKKGTTAILSTFDVNRAPFEQQKRIFFDGKKIDDKIELTPVTNPKNVGFRIQFKTDFPYFYGGPVDFVFWEQDVDESTYEYTFKKITELKNVDNAFSDFVELPELINTSQVTKSYVFKVFKAGTEELPYTEEADLSNISSIEYNFGIINNMKAGESKLFIVRPYYTEKMVGDSYEVEDIANFFH